jgi:hypothetical protein
MNISIEQDGPPQKRGTIWSASIKGKRRIVLGQTTFFKDADGEHLGLGVGSKLLKNVPQLVYDRHLAENEWGLWSHFLWPTVSAESYGGYHLIYNTYDRARFTFGFYQLAAHTPDDNLILLFRELLALPSAKTYVPDLALIEGKVTQLIGSGQQSLEEVTKVTRPNGKKENQLLHFMKYFNPDDKAMEQTEALRCAQLTYWMLDDPEALKAAIRVPFKIMITKIGKRLIPLKLTGRRPEIVIWVSDILHQGRGATNTQTPLERVRAALNLPDEDQQYQALFSIGSESPKYNGRRQTVHRCIQTLRAEHKFDGVEFGKGKLALPA